MLSLKAVTACRANIAWKKHENCKKNKELDAKELKIDEDITSEDKIDEDVTFSLNMLAQIAD